MAKIRKSTVPPAPVLFMSDLFTLIFSCGPGFLGALSALAVLRRSWIDDHFLCGAVLTPFVFFAVFLAAVAGLRLFIPRMKPGIYPIKVNRGFFSWYLHFALNRAPYFCGISPVLNSFYLLRFLYWRAMGLRAPFRVTTSMKVSMIDLPLITIGERSTLADGVHISCHSFVGDKLLLEPVEIGQEVFLGMNCVIGPGTKIGNGSWIGFGNRLLADKLPESSSLANFEWEHGNPAKLDVRKPKSTPVD